MWVAYAILSAFFASVTAVLAKMGMSGINANLATAIRTMVVLIMAWTIVLFTGQHHGLNGLTRQNWAFLLLSDLSTGLSWLFYFKALQMGDASIVVPIDKFSVVITIFLAFLFLGETLTPKTIIGGLFITAGTFILILK